MAQPRIAVFCLFQCFEEKEYQTESKRNETFWRSYFWKESYPIDLECTSGKTRGSHEVGGAPTPTRRALHPCGPPIAPPMFSFLLYISTYPQTIRTGAKNLIPPPQLSVSTRSHLGACFGAPPEGASITEGFYINTIASPMMCE